MTYYIDKYHISVTRRGGRGSRNNMQALHRLKNYFKQKTRKRKYKARVTNAAFVAPTSRGLTVPRRNGFVGFRVKRACRMSYNMFIAAEKAIMATKQKVWLKYRRYPNDYVTKKSTKSRMGKGKGKIWGRVLKIQRGEVVFDAHFKSPLKSRKWIVAVKRTLPVPATLVYKNKYAARALKNIWRARLWRAKFRRKRRKKKKWQIQVRRIKPLYEVPELFTENVLDMAAYLKFKPKHLRRYGRGRIRRLRWMWRDWAHHRGHRRAVDFAPRRGVAYPNPWRPQYFRASFENASGGGRERDIVGRKIAMLRYVRRFVAALSAPDEDGYYGRYKWANALLKRRRANDVLLLARRGAVPLAGKF